MTMRETSTKRRAPLLALCLLSIILAAPALAAKPSPAKRLGGIVRLGQDVEVQAGDTVEGPVIALRGSITVHGKVNGPVVSLGGSVALKPGASVNGPAIAVGGSSVAEPGSEAKGPLLELPASLIQWRKLALWLAPLLGTLGGLWLAYKILSSLGWVALAVVAWVLFPKALENSAKSLENRPGLAALAGLLFWPSLGALSLALLVSILGIPVLPVLALASVCLWFWGFSTLGYFLGRRLSRGAWTSLPCLLAGTLLIQALYFLPLVRHLACLAVAVFGIGAALTSRLGTRALLPKAQAIETGGPDSQV